MKGRLSYHHFNPELIIPTPVLHAQGKDSSRLPWGFSTMISVPPLLSLCPILTQLTWNWVRWTNAPLVTWHRQGVQLNWTDLSDWGRGVRQQAHVLPLPGLSVTEEGRRVDTAERKGWRLLLKSEKLIDKGVKCEESDRQKKAEKGLKEKKGEMMKSVEWNSRVAYVCRRHISLSVCLCALALWGSQHFIYSQNVLLKA